MSAANCETVLITGASSGIGLELAKCFAADSSRLVLVARNQDTMEKLAEELRRKNKIEVIVVTADLSLPETPKRIFQELSARNIFVDVLVNNAGFGLHEAFVKLPLQRQLEIIQVNVTALTELTGLFLPEMIR
ncbi:MAG TPA: SDR family NAD(P)-dependent oxidoreductase, partial [Candidatus Paceibacterota bacterium]|nr:SDR family NAD(P)-dependent oxidoreductase [Candidatus Paceibacterota bacterium]